MTSEEDLPAADRHDRSRRRPRAVTVAMGAGVVVIAAAVAALAFAVLRPPDDPVADALSIARSEDGYGTGLEAGRTLARTASALNRGIRECDREHEPDRCAALGATSGYVQVVAATVIQCTAPGRSDARRSVVALLEELHARETGDPPPRTPPIPRCREEAHSSSSTSSGSGTQPSLSSW